MTTLLLIWIGTILMSGSHCSHAFSPLLNGFLPGHVSFPNSMRTTAITTTTALSSSWSPNNDNNKGSSSLELPPDTLETLLQVHLVTQPGVSRAAAQQAVVKYTQSFPFYRVLPLEPLMQMPTADDGVEIKFLVNGVVASGGLRVSATLSSSSSLQVTAKRLVGSTNSRDNHDEAERSILTAFAAGLMEVRDWVQVTSLYHPWMLQDNESLHHDIEEGFA